MNIHGIFPPVTTPFDAREEVDLGAFKANLARLLNTGIRGVVVLGSNGEAPLPAATPQAVDVIRALLADLTR
jgi:dihydrodipicolinate synthase/N-acetylneuraminate lyase